MLILYILLGLFVLWGVKGFFFGGEIVFIVFGVFLAVFAVCCLLASLETEMVGNFYDLMFVVLSSLSVLYFYCFFEYDTSPSPFKLIIKFILKTFFLITAMPKVLEEVYWKER